MNNSKGVEAQFAAILADATKLYDSSDKGPSLKEFLTPPMKSVSDLTLQLTIQNDQFSHFREKRQKIFDAVGAVLRPVELIGDIVAEGASEVFRRHRAYLLQSCTLSMLRTMFLPCMIQYWTYLRN